MHRILFRKAIAGSEPIGVLGLVVLLSGAVVNGAFATTMDEAAAQCREQLAPAVRNCVRNNVIAKRGSPEQYIPGCRNSVAPEFRACIAKLIGAAGFKQNTIDAAKPAAKPAATPAVGAAVEGPRARPVTPRTIADITAILDQEKPDPARLKQFREAADAAEPGKSAPVALAHFLFGRAVARAELGRFREAIGDGERAVELANGKVDQMVLSNFRLGVAGQYSSAGEPQAAVQLLAKMAEDGERAGANGQGFLFSAYSRLASVYVTLGDFQRAQSTVARLETLWRNARATGGYQAYGKAWESLVEYGKATVAEARGELALAQASYQRSETLVRAQLQQPSTAIIVVPRSTLLRSADRVLLSIAQVKSRQGRLAEAEADARRAVLNRLQEVGKYNPSTASSILAFGGLLLEQGRYAEARQLIAAGIDVYREIGVAEDSQAFIGALAQLAGVQALQGSFAEAAQSYAAIERTVNHWDTARRERVLLTHGYIETLYQTGRIDDGLTAARRLTELKSARLGPQYTDTALARAHYAAGLARAKRDTEAAAEFRAAIPNLAAVTFNTDNDDVVNAAARIRYFQVVVESAIELMARTQSGREAAGATFRMAESIRGRAVQKALTASGARMSVSDPALAAAVREEQDLRQQVGAQLGALNTLLALPASERDEAGVAELRKQIDKLRAEHTRLRADIDRRFPDYADLIDPRPPTLEQIRESLRPGEALLSLYFGRERSFAWIVGKDGATDFARLDETAASIDAKVAKLRSALEPQPGGGGPAPFDVALAHELYKSLLEPLRPAWQNARSLIVVSNGALGLLPLGLLVTAPHVVAQDGPAFAGYRAVPWLARTHTVTLVPSASALRSLRRLPAGSGKRDQLVGFGDPFFNAEQAKEDAGAAPIQVAANEQGEAVRGQPSKRRSAPLAQGVDNAALGELPRLPDTADELRAIAHALAADPGKALHLGKEANEQVVKKLDLTRYRVVAFATHGLLPGELDGLTQPALALSAPAVAGVDGDGLLMMDEILSLKLDADWVVLSACNTGAAAAAGAEAASGLGRAFFYAGTRAVLVTNWSVYSDAAQKLVSDLFQRQAADPTLMRGEALRLAMLALLDSPGVADPTGKVLYTYGHPVFWAAYSLIGDGGGG